MAQHAGYSRWVYNWGLATKIRLYQEGIKIKTTELKKFYTNAKRTDLAYNSFFQGLRGLPKFKSIRFYSGWTYPSSSGWKVNSNGKNGTVTLNDLIFLSK